jgi:hypothetical protein
MEPLGSGGRSAVQHLVDLPKRVADHALLVGAGPGQRVALDPGQQGQRGGTDVDHGPPVRGRQRRPGQDAGRVEHRGDRQAAGELRPQRRSDRLGDPAAAILGYEPGGRSHPTVVRLDRGAGQGPVVGEAGSQARLADHRR